MSYRFNGTSDYVEFALGPLTGYTFGPVTEAFFVKHNADSGRDDALTCITNSSLAPKFLCRFSGGELQLNNPAVGSATSNLTLSSTSIWYLLAVTWAGGAGTPRFHVHNGTSWTHQNAVGSTLGNYAVTGTDRFRAGAFSANFLSADFVCAGIKKADSTDLQVEALTRTSFTSWTGFGFDWLIGFDSSFVSAGVLQDQASPGSGDEVSRSGTSLVSDPAGWVWVAPVAPVADFTGTPLSGTEPLSVVFTDSSTNTPTSWAWTFGDGGTSSSQNPTHSYTTAGTYTVALVATNATGSNTKTRTGYVTVSDQPRPIRINTSQGWADIGDATSFVSGSGVPTVAVGATGAIYLNTATGLLYGPKSGGAWPGTPIGSISVSSAAIWDTKGDLAVATGADAAAKLPVGTDGQVLTADSAQTTGAKWATPSAGAAGALTLLSTTTLGSAASFDISSISGSYNDLILVAMLRCNVAATTSSPMLRFNNDSGSNYGYQRQSINSSTTTTQDGGAQASVDPGVVHAGSAAAGLFAALEFVIQGYASTTWKKIVEFRNQWGLDVTSGNKQIYQGMSFWNSTAAITRVQLLVNSVDTTFATGSQLRIYGRL